MHEIKRIPLEGVHNTRDLGGFTAADGRCIKSCRLIRSGDLHNLTQGDKRILKEEYGLTTVIDFRTETECREKPDQEIEGVRYIANPILAEETLGITRESNADKNMVAMVLSRLNDMEAGELSYMENMYINLVTNDFSKGQYRKFFEILMAQESGAVLWHCTAGKDRVGTGTALLLSALGVPREQILADYMMTNEFSADSTKQAVRKVQEKTGNAELAEKLRLLFGVQESYLNMIFQTIEENYGTVKSYLEEEMGLTDHAVGKLREKYLC